MFISIIIPTLNRSLALNSTLESVALLITKSNVANVEVLLIDNGSTDDTKLIFEKWAVQLSCLKYFYEPVPGLLSGRHRGAMEAKGDIFCFIDDDVLLSSTWLATIMETMNDRLEIALMSGPNLPRYESTPPSWLNYFWSSTPYGGKECIWLSLLDLGDKELLIDANYVWGLNFIIRKRAFLDSGGFHPDNISKSLQQFQGDGETGLTMKANEMGLKALYHPGAMLYHQVPTKRMTYEYFDQRAYYQGVGNSFTDLRRSFGLYKNEIGQASAKKANQFRLLVSKLKTILRKSFFSGKTLSEIQIIKRRFAAKQAEGYQFHQNAFKENEIVRTWVLKDNYFDYKLPI